MSNLGWCESAVGTYPGGWLWLLPPPLSGALGGTGLDRQVLSGLCVVLLLKGGVYMTRSSPSVCFSSLKSNPDSVWATWCGKDSACNAGDPGSIPELGRSPGGGIGYPLQYFGPENSMDCIVHGVTKS